MNTIIKKVYRAGFNALVRQPEKSKSLLVVDEPLWRDISSHQGVWNAMVSYKNGVQGAYIRAGYGLAPDTKFAVNYHMAELAYLYRTSYWAVYPNQDMITQLELWYKAHPVLDRIPRVMDVEVQGGKSASYIGAFVEEFAEAIYTRDLVWPIIYSRANLINSWLANWTTANLNRFYYILAQYLYSGAEHPGPVTLPNRVASNRVILHQTSDHKPDFEGEADSLSIDWNRGVNLWKTHSGMREFIDYQWPATETGLTLEQRVEALEYQVKELRAYHENE